MRAGWHPTKPDFVPAADAGDTIATAAAIALPVDGTIKVPGTVGDGANGTKDVDLYAVTLAAGDVLRLNTNGTAFYNHLRVFDAAGVALADQYMSPSGNTPLQFKAPGAGSYYIGVSGYYNNAYNPNVAGSGDNGGYTGAYQLSIERRRERYEPAGVNCIDGLERNAGTGRYSISQHRANHHHQRQ